MIHHTFKVKFDKPLRDVVDDHFEHSRGTSSVVEKCATEQNVNSNPQLDTGADRLLFQQLFSDLSHQLDELEARRKQSLAEMQQLAVELAIGIAGKFVYETIQQDEFPFHELIHQMISQLQTDQPITIHLNPCDWQTVSERMEQLQPEWYRAEQMKLEPSPALPRGRCQIEAGRYALFYDAGLQLSEIRQRILESLHEAEIERRTTVEDGSQLRRFPNRRSFG